MTNLVELVLSIISDFSKIANRKHAEKPGRDAVNAEQFEVFKEQQMKLSGSQDDSKNEKRREELHKILK